MRPQADKRGGGWRSQPMSREYFGNSLRRSREIERETEGFVSPEAMKDIEEEAAAHWDGEDLEP